MRLKLASDLSLPLDVVTQTIAILAKRRAGKSYTMRRLVEQLHQAGQQVVLVDPKGDQWGIRSAADGKAPGLPIVILGGERADVPLESNGGEIVATLVVEERVSVLLDLSLFRKHELATFMTGFLENLYRLKAREIYRTPLMLVIDEADAVAPQKPQKGEERMLGAAEDIVRRGGQRGIGCVLVTQRSAVLNKNVLTQAQMLVALRTIAPQDLEAMKAWIDVHGTLAQQKTLMESLPSLPVGDAWFWSPGWPTVDGIFKRVHVLPIETFDSGATPKPGEKRVEPKTAADVDLEALKRQMAATIEKAKADDPRELRKRITNLEKQIKSARTQQPVAYPHQPVAFTDADRALLSDVALRIATQAKKAHDLIAAAESRLDQRVTAAVAEYLDVTRTVGMDAADAVAKVLERVGLQKILTKLEGVGAPVRQVTIAKPVVRLNPEDRPRPAARVSVANTNGHLAGGERKILSALAQYPGGRSKTQVALLTGYAHTGGGFNNYLSALRSKGYLAGRGNNLQITDDGLTTLGAFDPLPTGAALIDHWMRQLGKAERSILAAVVEAYPRAVTKDELGAATGYEPNGGGFNNALSRLRTLELIRGRGEVKASDELFD